MNIKPKQGILLIKKHKQTALKRKIALQEDDSNKNLISGEILSENRKGETVIFGKYALLSLTLQGEDYHFLDENDIIATCSYKEDV